MEKYASGNALVNINSVCFSDNYETSMNKSVMIELSLGGSFNHVAHIGGRTWASALWSCRAGPDRSVRKKIRQLTMDPAAFGPAPDYLEQLSAVLFLTNEGYSGGVKPPEERAHQSSFALDCLHFISEHVGTWPYVTLHARDARHGPQLFGPFMSNFHQHMMS